MNKRSCSHSYPPKSPTLSPDPISRYQILRFLRIIKYGSEYFRTNITNTASLLSPYIVGVSRAIIYIYISMAATQSPTDNCVSGCTLSIYGAQPDLLFAFSSMKYSGFIGWSYWTRINHLTGAFLVFINLFQSCSMYSPSRPKDSVPPVNQIVHLNQFPQLSGTSNLTFLIIVASTSAVPATAAT